MASRFPDVSLLTQFIKDRLIYQLENIPGLKDLVLDGELMKPLDRIIGASVLKAHGVAKIFKLDTSQKAISGCHQRLYIVRPRIEVMEHIASQIQCERSLQHKRTYQILMTPRKLNVCEEVLEREGVYGYVSVEEFNLDLIPLDRDVLSLELSDFLPRFYLHNDYTWLHTVAKSLVHLQSVYRQIPFVCGIGRAAKKVHEMVLSMTEYHQKAEDGNFEIGKLFIIDRDVDFITPLSSQLTYEGMLDETFGIQSGFIELTREITGKDKPTRLLLSSQDEIFDQIRNKHFSTVFEFLSWKVKEVQTGYDKRHSLTTVGAMKNFVSNELKDLSNKHKTLAYHIGACEVIMAKKMKTFENFEEIMQTEHSLLEGSGIKENINFIEECINRKFNVEQTLRLLCLLSLTTDGIYSKQYKQLTVQFIQTYGFDMLPTLHNLRKLHLFMEQEAALSKPLGKVAAAMAKKNSYLALVKKLNLVPKSAEDINLKSPRDMSYVFSGAYTPTSCRLVEEVLNRNGFSGLEDVTKLLPGETFCSIRSPIPKGKSQSPDYPAARVVMVFFLGGCTFAEISALRLLGREKGYQFLIATTCITNGSRMIQSFMEK
ncbi:vacuolar protein sorting-associated protein 33B-like [Argonauta hians]